MFQHGKPFKRLCAVLCIEETPAQSEVYGPAEFSSPAYGFGDSVETSDLSDRDAPGLLHLPGAEPHRADERKKEHEVGQPSTVKGDSFTFQFKSADTS